VRDITTENSFSVTSTIIGSPACETLVMADKPSEITATQNNKISKPYLFIFIFSSSKDIDGICLFTAHPGLIR
jgi:hypothetical protein